MADLTRDEIARLLADATPGPWTVGCNGYPWTADPDVDLDDDRSPSSWSHQYVSNFGSTIALVVATGREDANDRNRRDARLIAAAPAIADQLVRTLDRLAERDAEVARLRERVERLEADADRVIEAPPVEVRCATLGDVRAWILSRPWGER